jgi:hypothetical protein
MVSAGRLSSFLFDNEWMDSLGIVIKDVQARLFGMNHI